MKNALSSIKPFLPYIIGLVLLGGVVYGFVSIWRTIKGTVGGLFGGLTGTGEAEEQRNAVAMSAVADPPQSSMSIAPGEAGIRAARIHSALDDWENDEDVVYGALDGCNKYDLQAIFKAFGYRDYYFYGNPKNLYQWFDEEMWWQADQERLATIFRDCDIPYTIATTTGI